MGGKDRRFRVEPLHLPKMMQMLKHLDASFFGQTEDMLAVCVPAEDHGSGSLWQWALGYSA